jgi:UPF0755 protein
MTRILLGGGLLLVATIVAFVLISAGLFAFSPYQAGTQESMIFEVTRGQAPAQISASLATQGVIKDASAFRWLGRLTAQWPKIKAGEYKVSAAMTPMEIFATFTSGVSVARPVTVREGENFYEIAAELEARGLAQKTRFLQLCKSPEFIQTLGLSQDGIVPKTVEGYLYPETYHFTRGMTPEEMIKQMTSKFLSIWTPAEDARAKEFGFTRHQVVTLASMIEKETGAEEERPMISSVFHNRLRKKMRLQSDPTTVYGIWERYSGNIRKADLLEATPYNTYAIPALPLGPISNPGKLAIQAALNPLTSENLYFVSQNDGTHVFSRTFEEHNSAVRKFQMDPKARAGKSWRDLVKKRAGANGN